MDGLHFHTLCEQGADALEITLKAVEEKFGKYLYGMKWLNLRGWASSYKRVSSQRRSDSYGKDI